MSPQCTTVLNHLRKTGSITGVEAESVHRIRHLPSRIFELNRQRDEKGRRISIDPTTQHDVTGQRYVRYFLRSV